MLTTRKISFLLNARNFTTGDRLIYSDETILSSDCSEPYKGRVHEQKMIMKNKNEEIDRAQARAYVRIEFPPPSPPPPFLFHLLLLLLCLFVRNRGRRSLVVPTSEVVLVLVSNSYKQKETKPRTDRLRE